MIRLLASNSAQRLYISPTLVEAILSGFDTRIADVGVVRRSRQSASDLVDALVVVEDGLELDKVAIRRFLREELASLPSHEVEEGVADALSIGNLDVIHADDIGEAGPIVRNTLGKPVRRHFMRYEIARRDV